MKKSREDMTSVQEILLSELTQARSYVERILHAVCELSDTHLTPKARVVIQEFSAEYEKLVCELIIPSHFGELNLIHQDNFRQGRENLRIMNNFIESFVALGPKNDEEVVGAITRLINLVYKYTRELHLVLIEKSSLDVATPRMGLLKAIDIKEKKEVIKPHAVIKKGPFTLIEGGRVDEIDEDEFEDEASLNPPLYFLETLEILNLAHAKTAPILGMNAKREEKYEQNISQAHVLVSKKDLAGALELFEKARGHKETAEVLTLMAWVNSQMGNNEEAKSLCLKAIEIDPEYGAPYNDLGTLLLNEGHINESIKWYELAKKAPKYTNREYPYINAGRAYMQLNNFDKAMEEFEVALKLVPENQELRHTVSKIRASVLKEEDNTTKRGFQKFKVDFSDNQGDNDNQPTQ
ncbi:tetratricopeptide repeat protein [Halobacteriovorax vibrionivorans]|uniref:Tetratricopeptide repeat protein n=1 Tax=Halobacteriovorax vibrionivorans TaxID=2152716 RepID=A0ABY0IDF8_9BACT|nr:MULTISPECIES: tetratricopeptide repeat protein [Halobacteriovorax]RZF20996.1 tetratricopeptide repeat protein [Halobacteriovorax vibrionivorans]TGD46769.1 tetratricopeptide repeat protein [Halobacteriovorax sp. Y22]